eukprot:146671_1
MSTYASCAFTNSTDCPTAIDLTYETAVYCCDYVMGNPRGLHDQISQEGLFHAITLVRDLNIASLISDYVFVIIAIASFFGVRAQTDSWKKAKQITLILTALGSFADVVITFTVVGIIDQNNLVNGMSHLYENQCYSESLERTILDLENQFQTVLILDVVEGVLDIISLVVLACGFAVGIDAISTCTEGIHTFMFMVFDVAIISTNVFVFLLPSYSLFKDAYNDETLLCFKNTNVDTSYSEIIQITTTYLPDESLIDASNTSLYMAISCFGVGFVACWIECLIVLSQNQNVERIHQAMNYFVILVAGNLLNIVIVIMSIAYREDACATSYYAIMGGCLVAFASHMLYWAIICFGNEDVDEGARMHVYDDKNICAKTVAVLVVTVAFACAIVGSVGYAQSTEECKDTTSGRCLIAWCVINMVISVVCCCWVAYKIYHR